MTRSMVHSLIFVLGLAVLLSAQTRDTVREKYGPPDEHGRYKVRDGITLEATFSANGYPLAISIKPVDPNIVTDVTRKIRSNPKTMNKETALAILEEIVPSKTRGKETASFSESHGCTSINSTEHEFLVVSIVTRCEVQGGGTYAVHVRWRNKPA